ncbi:MAG TPA: tyrosine-type recombinase/integrase [Thermoanaerobaculia bacterium]|nr:tyrosine-type recombinase/integrase [Thermoanaerobaculia bacterium]
MGLTDRQIRSATVRKGQNQRDLRDQQVRGLFLRVYTSGVRTWFLSYRRKPDNRRRIFKLGEYPGVSLAQARELAEIELGKIATGKDPQKDRVAARERSTAETIAALAERYLEEYAKLHKRPKGYAMDRWQLDAYVLPRWGERPIDEVTKQDVRGLVQDLADGKLAAKGKPTKVAPRNLKALLSKMFDWATDQGLLPGNPAAGVKLPARVREHQKKGGRDRVLSDEEIEVLWAETDRLEEVAVARGHAPVSAAAFRLILLTAQRPGEVFSMRWRDIEDGSWWVIPAEVAKNGEANRVPLSPQVRTILDELQPLSGGGEFVLPSPFKRGAHLKSLKTVHDTILRNSGMRPWTPHDLRRTAASKMSADGVPRRVLRAILNHKDRSVTAVYDRYSLDRERREALIAWGRRVEEIVGGGPVGAVIEFPVRAATAVAAEPPGDWRRGDRG